MLDISTLSAPVKKGSKPLSPAKFQNLINRSLKRVLPDPQPTQLTLSQFEQAKALNAYMMHLQMEAYANNVFNHQLVKYREAVDTLTQSKGRDEVKELIETGEIDTNGEPEVIEVIIVQATEPWPAEIEVTTVDPETGETVVSMVANPKILQAQTTINETPQEVIDFDREN